MTAAKKRRRKKRVDVKKRAKSIDELDPKDIKPAPYNPRVMQSDSKRGLKKSIEKFKDISGITWNKQTGNIVTGHHRWEEIVELYGLEELTFKQLTDDRLQITTKDDEDTGYILRVVNWDEATEKAANVTANSHKISGEFTDGLKDILADVKFEFHEDDFSGLRLDDLSFEFDYLNKNLNASAGSDEWDTDIEAVKNTEEDDHQKKPEFATISVTVKTDQKQEALGLIKEALEGHEFEVK